jgi:hypothetical protein
MSAYPRLQSLYIMSVYSRLHFSSRISAFRLGCTQQGFGLW